MSTNGQKHPPLANGSVATVARLADAKRLPVEFLRGLGLTDGRRRVAVPYPTPPEGT
jgi:hypothetical protein